MTSDWLVQSDGPVRGGARPGLITDDCAQEGLAREVVNRVQRLRKDAGYEYHHADRAGDRRRGAGAARRHGTCRRSSAARRWPGSSTWGSGPHVPTASSRSISTASTRSSEFSGTATNDRPTGRHSSAWIRGNDPKKQLSTSRSGCWKSARACMKELGYYDESFNADARASDGDLSLLLLPHGRPGHRRDGAGEAVPLRVAGGPVPLARQLGAAPAVQLPREVRHLRGCGEGDQLRAAGRAAPRAALHRGCKEKEEDAKRR